MEPSAARVAKARLTRFIADLGEPGVSDYPSLYAWSLQDPESFWAAVWRFCGVVSGRGWDRVVEGGDRMPGARWFPSATLNFAENLMDRYDRLSQGGTQSASARNIWLVKKLPPGT